jgi:release factor glutamine methyltransferase
LNAPASPRTVWTIINLITWGTSYLSERRCDDARLTIELLLAHVLRLKRIDLYTNFDKPLTEEELAAFKALLKRRLAHEPLQYIIGETEFMGLKFSVDPRVLIPRPETEILVEQTLAEIRDRWQGVDTIHVLDIGTGSGCIAVSLASLNPLVQVTAIDASAGAIDVARINAERNGVSDRVSFACVDILNDATLSSRFHCLVSNPPYISDQEYRLVSDEVRNFEPAAALTDGGDGLTFYRALAERCGPLLEENGSILVEHAYDQSDAVRKIFQEHGWKNISTIKDYAGHFRFIKAAQ